MKRAAATVWLPSRRFTRTFRPFTSNSTTCRNVSAACRGAGRTAHEISVGQPGRLERLWRQHRKADVRFALDVRGHVPADVGARCRPQPLEIAAIVIEAG